jgi:hypothetical protein
MALVPSTVGDNSSAPFGVATLYNPDQLIAGDLKLVTQGSATITGNAALPRGTVMGKITVGAVAFAAKAGGNTGNGTLSALSAGTRTIAGVYTVRMLSATTFNVVDPYGEPLPAGAALGAYANAGINFTIAAGGTAFVAGDGFDITVAAGSASYRKAVATAVDGSQVPAAILADDSDPSGGDVNGGVYLTGEFNQNKIAYDNSFTLAALRDLLRVWNIHLKSAMSNLPPT